MEKIKIGNKDYSKIIVGTNAFYGHSHFSAARDSEYKKKFSDDYIKNLLELCFSKGVNSIETCANERIVNIINGIKIKDNDIITLGLGSIEETEESIDLVNLYLSDK